MSFITNLKLAFTEGFHDTARAVSRDWKSLGNRLQGDAKLMAATAHAVDQLAHQEDNVFAWTGIKSLSALYGASSTVVRGVVGFAYGAPDFVATVASRPQNTPKLIWDGMQHCSSETVTGKEGLTRGDLAQGLSHFLDGTSQAWIMVAGGRGMVRGALHHGPAAFKTFADGVNTMLSAGKVVTPNTPINLWARGYERGAIVVGDRMVSALQPAEFERALRQPSVTNNELMDATLEPDMKLATIARRILQERTHPIPAGYAQIPSGRLKGQVFHPFLMKKTPVTNGEWLQGVDGKPRYVLLVEDRVTKAIHVEDIMTKPPSSVKPKINLEAGEVVIRGSQILVRLVDNPSFVHDGQALLFTNRVFSRRDQPVVGVTYYHAQAWVLTEASGRLSLPTGLRYEAVASNFGKQIYGTATGELYAYEDLFTQSKLGRFNSAHEGRRTTVSVNDPRYPAGPYGVQTFGNVWRWTQADPREIFPHGLRGASWDYNFPERLRADGHNEHYPVHHDNTVGFQPVIVSGFPK